jgi:hypothetical protein
MYLFVVSDHGHSPVHQHFDLADELRASGVRVRSHPWTTPKQADAAVMVSGNSMAHLYLGLDHRTRRHGGDLAGEWEPRMRWLQSHPAVDLVATWSSPSTIHVAQGDAGASITFSARGASYRTATGNPLALDEFEHLCAEAVYERTRETDYPDSIAQLVSLVPAARSGDIVISAAPGWDLRRRYEPIDHVSSHGALLAAHMLVPLLANRRPAVQLQRTTDLYTSTLHALHVGDAPRLTGFGRQQAAGRRKVKCD